MEIKYDMTLDDVEKGFKLFQRKYLFKRSMTFCIVYLIIIVLAADLVIKNPSSFYGYIALAVGLALQVHNWYNPVLVRKRLVKTMSSMYEEKYTAVFYDNRLEINTEVFVPEAGEEISPEENNLSLNEAENNSSEIAEDTEVKEDTAVSEVLNDSETDSDNSVETSIWYFGSDFMESKEIEDMFLIFVRRSLIYIFPKKCLSLEEQSSLRKILEDKAI